MSFMCGQLDWDAVNKPTDPLYPLLRTCDYASYNPGYEPSIFATAKKADAKMLAYVSSISVPQVDTANPFWKGLIALFPPNRLYCDPTGKPITFGSPDWPLAQMKRTFGNCDRLLTYLSTQSNIRGGDGIYLDEATDTIPQWMVDQFAAKGCFIKDEDQWKHAHFMNRVICGMREINDWDGDDKLLIGNTAATWTHRSLDAASIEIERPGQGGAKLSTAIAYANEQALAGRNRMKCVAWYAPPTFVETHSLMAGSWF